MKSGFTLLELIIVIVIGAIIAAGTVTVLKSSWHAFARNEEAASVNTGILNVFTQLSSELREAGYINSSNPTPNANISVSSNSISFNLDTPTASNPDGAGTYSTVSYYLQNNNLYRKAGSSVTQVNPPNILITSFVPTQGSIDASGNFKQGNGNFVQIQLTAKTTNSNNLYYFTKEIYLRNAQ